MNVRLYAAGGMGSNVAKQLNNLDIDVCYIDTSMSNLKTVSDSEIFLVPDIDGAGKDRRVSYEGFKDIVSDVLIKFKPSNVLNIVISSLSGGSGSVVAPLLTKELISNGHNTIVIGVDSRHSAIEINNSIKTLKSYKAISDSVKKCVNLYHIKNTKRSEADKEAINFINLLMTITNKHHTDEFDTTDLHNFINFNKVTDVSPSVSILDATVNDGSLPVKGMSVVSTILVTGDNNSSIKEPIPDYLCNCVITDKAYSSGEIRINNLLGALSLVVTELEKEMVTLQDQRKLNKVKDIEVTDSNEDDLVL